MCGEGLLLHYTEKHTSVLLQVSILRWTTRTEIRGLGKNIPHQQQQLMIA